MPLIYLLGGPMRTGKSQAARRFNKRTGISYISTDDLFRVLGLAAPQLKIGWDSGNSWRDNRELLTPFLVELARIRVQERNPILIEGELSPQTAGSLSEELGAECRACFVGSADLSLAAKVDALQAWSDAQGDWLSDGSPDLTEWAARESLAASLEYRQAATQLGIPYFELSGDFEAAVERLVRYLVG
jgi:hypothetical protein